MHKTAIPWNKIKDFLILYLVFGIGFIALITLKEHTFDIGLVYKLIESNPVSIYDIQWFGVFWFILAYGIVLILSNIKIFSYLSVSLIVFLFLYFVQDTSIFDSILYLPLCIAPAFLLLLFFNIGKQNHLFMQYFSTKNMIILAILFMLLNIFNIYQYDGFSSKLINYGVLHLQPNIILVLLVGMSGILSTLYISKYIELNQIKLSMILQFFGKHSLFIFIWHMFILYFVHSMMIKAFGSKDMEFTYWFQGIKFLIAILLLVIGIFIYQKILLKVKNR
jgi:hypothetical protein